MLIFLHFRTPAAAAAGSVTYRDLEERINKWTLELEEQEKMFLQQATQVNAWERMLITNGEKVLGSIRYTVNPLYLTFPYI